MELKHFDFLLSSLVKKLYHKDKSITNEYLQEGVIDSQLGNDQVLTLVDTLEPILLQIGHSDLSQNALEKLLEPLELRQDFHQHFLKYWEQQRDEIRSIVRNELIFNDRLSGVSWRVDMKTNSKKISNINQPIAIVELLLSRNQQEREDTKSIMFEIDKTQISNLVNQIEEIESLLEKGIQQKN
ncbi:comm domain-containing protein [Anaeramoeba flamelloides]|uniref:COMM domain-containing protein 1 n=1 Tax=Anaeramoeba flamelloides TaxID=1746091 RepID=A0AAV7YKX5_9EUKA|nr:comm domain-containing protein [Anaeramoeba flamelloides]